VFRGLYSRRISPVFLPISLCSVFWSRVKWVSSPWFLYALNEFALVLDGIAGDFFPANKGLRKGGCSLRKPWKSTFLGGDFLKQSTSRRSYEFSHTKRIEPRGMLPEHRLDVNPDIGFEMIGHFLTQRFYWAFSLVFSFICRERDTIVFFFGGGGFCDTHVFGGSLTALSTDLWWTWARAPALWYLLYMSEARGNWWEKYFSWNWMLS